MRAGSAAPRSQPCWTAPIRKASCARRRSPSPIGWSGLSPTAPDPLRYDTPPPHNARPFLPATPTEPSSMSHKILLLPGDGIGPEVMAEAEKVLAALAETGIASIETE